jgi:hypothetical protein
MSIWDHVLFGVHTCIGNDHQLNSLFIKHDQAGCSLDVNFSLTCCRCRCCCCSHCCFRHLYEEDSSSQPPTPPPIIPGSSCCDDPDSPSKAAAAAAGLLSRQPGSSSSKQQQLGQGQNEVELVVTANGQPQVRRSDYAVSGCEILLC